ncbi:MAG: AEC family transporter [Candidatus Omnitrophica bacterium]|nr:AEC family transporter [Candidatus Omnitrophota bacterium]
MNLIALAIIKLVFIAVLGYYLYRRNVIDERILKFLNEFVINVTVPFLIFSHLIENDDIVRGNSLLLFVALSFLIFFLSSAIGFIYSLIRGVSPRFKREFISLVAFQNCGYLPMNLVYVLLENKLRENFLIYIFLYLFGFNIMMWSVGSFFIFRKKGEKFKVSTLFTPPVTATLIGIVLVFFKASQFVPNIIISPIKMVGDMSFVLSMIILGAQLGKIELDGFKQRIKLIIEASFLKLVVVPFVFLLLMIQFDKTSLIGFFVVFEAAMPSAASLLLVARLKMADSSFIAQTVLLTHIASIVTIPVWVAIFVSWSGITF